jgi:DNA-binding transcriptional LysR family regulator
MRLNGKRTNGLVFRRELRGYPAEPAPLSAVYPQGRHRMPKVRALLEFLVERFSHAPWRQPDLRR